MAEVDIICDDHQQAAAKLNGVEALLAGTGALSPSEEGGSVNHAREDTCKYDVLNKQSKYGGSCLKDPTI